MATRGSMENDVSLSSIENEINDLYNQCKNIGLSDEEIERLAKPILIPFDISTSRKRKRHVIAALAVFVVVGFILSLGALQDVLYVYARVAAIKVLPYVDWQPIYRSPCAIENPFYENNKDKITTKDCEVCEDLDELDVRNNVSPNIVFERYVEHDIPLIIDDAMDDWEIMKLDAFETLTQGYLSESELMDAVVCMFETNLRATNHISLIRKIMSATGPIRWYSHWENCDITSQKYLRKYYKRPNFLPAGLEMTLSNWIFLSSHYKGQNFKLIEPEDRSNVIWFGQALGQNRVQLLPKEECRDKCPDLKFTLEKGQIVLVPLRMWSLQYGPGRNSTNLAIAATGYLN